MEMVSGINSPYKSPRVPTSTKLQSEAIITHEDLSEVISPASFLIYSG